MKNFNDTNGNRTRDLSVCSAVPQLTAPPPLDIIYECFIVQIYLRLNGIYICMYIYIYIYIYISIKYLFDSVSFHVMTRC